MTKRSGLIGFCAVALLGAAASVASAQVYSNGFEVDNAGWDVFTDDAFTGIRTASGTNGIVSADGNWHATGDVPATDWGGFSNVFPGNEYSTLLDIYLDTSGSIPNDTRIDFSSAVNTPAGGHRRDFIFHLGFYNASDNDGPGAGSNRYVVSASNNSPGWPKNPARSPIAIYDSGWYTLRHTFSRTAGDVLSVELTILDDNGTELGSWTLSTPSDVIGSTVGGNRYGWFATNELGNLLAFDNARKRGYFVIDTRNQTTIDGLEDAVNAAHAAALAVPAGSYANAAKAAEASAYAAHQTSKTVTYMDENDLPAALLTYKAYRYQQYKYHLRAAQYFHYAPGGGVAKTTSQTAGQLGNADYNAP